MSVAVSAAVRKILGSFMLLLLVSVPSAVAQSGIWGARGIPRQFLLRGNQLFAVDGRGVSVYDVTAGRSINRVSVVQSDDESLSAAFLGANELAVLTRGGIDRYRIAADGALSLLSRLPLNGYTLIAGNGRTGNDALLAGVNADGVTVWRPNSDGLDQLTQYAVPGRVNALAFHNDALYVAVEGVAVYVFSTRGDATPMALIPANGRALAFVGNTLYIAASVNGLIAVDVTSDAAPRVVSRTDAGEVNLQRIAAAGTRVYASNGVTQTIVYDASSGTPVRVASIAEPVHALAASGNRLFVSGSIVDAYGLTRETGTPVRIFDVAGPLALVTEYRDLAGPVSGVAISPNGSLAYVVDPPFFRVIDISKTAAPREIASLQIAGIEDRVRIFGTTALIYGRGTVNVVDISIPYAPRLITTYESQGIPPSSASMAGNELVEGNPASGFHVVDYRHYTPPGQIGGLKGHYFEVVARGDAGYIFEQDGIRVLDLSNRQDVKIVKDLRLAGRAAEWLDATAAHPELLLVYTPTGMQLFTLANPIDPIASGSLPFPQGGVFASSGDSAWFALPGSIERIDVTDPARPTVSATSMHPTSPMQMAAAGGKVVVADRYALRIYGPDTAAVPPPGAPKRRSARH